MQRKKLVSFLFCLALLCTGFMPAAAQSSNTLTYGAYESGPTTTWGTKRIENYGVAMLLKDPALVGLTITRLRIPFADDAENLSKGAVFLSKKLNVNNSQNVADVLVDSFAIQAGWVDVTLSQPYTITEEGIYAGYTFNVDKTSNNPIVTVNQPSEENLWVFTGRTFRVWKKKSAFLRKSLAMQVILTGAAPNAAGVSFADNITQLGAQPEIELSIHNHGTSAISSVDYTYEINGISNSAHQEFSTPIPVHFGRTANFNITLPQMTQKGICPLTVTINKVNNQANQGKLPSATQNMNVYTSIPKKRALVEEYTGTWCPWCPKGFVSMELLAKTLKEDFIGVAYHDRDPMAFSQDFPISIGGFPTASIDREEKNIDPFHGKSGAGFGMKTLVEQRNKRFTPMNISVKAYFTDEAETQIQAQSSTFSTRDLGYANYQVGYILVANGLTEAGDPYHQDGWGQRNNLVGEGSTFPEEEMKPFTNGSYLIKGLTFNFVACDRSSKHGIANSLPTKMTADTDYTHNYTFDLDKAKNPAKYPIYQNKKMLEVVAFIVDPTTNYVINACKTKVQSYATHTGVNDVTTAANETPVAYYSVDGKRLNAPQKGMNIVRLSNGTSRKIFIK